MDRKTRFVIQAAVEILKAATNLLARVLAFDLEGHRSESEISEIIGDLVTQKNRLEDMCRRAVKS